MTEIVEYVTKDSINPFARWFDSLDVKAALKVNTYVTRMSCGNFSQVKGVGKGVYECRIDFGPGYRVYFGKDGEKLVILLGGGTKKRQQRDIHQAQSLWHAYKKAKKEL